MLFGGDYLTSIKKEKLLIKSAKSVVENNKFVSNKLLNYSFNKKYVTETAKTLEIFSLTDKNFPNVSVIIKDTIDQSPVFLSFDDNHTIIEEENYIFRKTNYIKRTNQSEREYLNMVFDQKKPDTRYSSHSGEYELFYPYIKGNKIIVLYFYDHQRYGKIGS